MVPLAVSGKIVVSAVVLLAIVLLIVLFRMEDRDTALDEAEAEQPKRRP